MSFHTFFNKIQDNREKRKKIRRVKKKKKKSKLLLTDLSLGLGLSQTLHTVEESSPGGLVVIKCRQGTVIERSALFRAAGRSDPSANRIRSHLIPCDPHMLLLHCIVRVRGSHVSFDGALGGTWVGTLRGDHPAAGGAVNATSDALSKTLLPLQPSTAVANRLFIFAGATLHSGTTSRGSVEESAGT